MLTCSKCNQEKRESQFPVDNTKKRGFSYKCLECQRAYGKTLNYEPTQEPITCIHCKEEKAAPNFGINKRKPLGRNKICKPCHNKQIREQRQRQRIRESYDTL